MSSTPRRNRLFAPDGKYFDVAGRELASAASRWRYLLDPDFAPRVVAAGTGTTVPC